MSLLIRCLLILTVVSNYSAATAADHVFNLSTTAEKHEQGRKIYNYRCYFCHGYSGDAKTLASTYLTPKPRNFIHRNSRDLSRKYMIQIVTSGKKDTAMHGFSRLLTDLEIYAVVDFVRAEFIDNQRLNTRYHTTENGWPNHHRYAEAFPFATGSIPLDKPWQQLNQQQTRGKQLFLTSCITCHDRSFVNIEGDIWNKESISYPRNNYSHTIIDAVSSASIYAGHDIAPEVESLSSTAQSGKQLWQQNCAFCHAADGTGENWIGSFLEPNPRNLTDNHFMQDKTRDFLLLRIRNGLVNTSMPAWKNVLSDQQIHQIISYIDEAFHPIKQEVNSQL
ncbi:MAG: cytochrome c [Gammaproteobacteria bacterium]|jgi:cytochrome c oxidase cbb3-type subunit 3|nr:cytochrome c [Gammaproteobacteria bacterium]MBT3725717.1 cytochrome c [Gammaproteobacteria bacterium]MBT4076697.1 cytochrome c [Gammaproteobacteria bacterium]MBT4195473.1 cytochrome c [Gammaproteobacteria bacterium]MBT4449420.1 cytochrome c [Gammaproteobacteria bacterium]